ncbi:MAG: HAMP domain-containing histidine kinase [Propionibacteriales bacterium]|jgi:signal transduction histidine kinase|nr:HAMP domain-containing histidine kinase [Propionibacteriales bacterium]
MRRSLILTVAATTVMVLLAMLVPMALLVSQYAIEDRIARAALEVQATETVVSGQDKGSVSVYLESINSDRRSTLTTVLYPDGTAIGPIKGEDARVRQARKTGQARVDDVPGGSEILVPVSLGGSSALPVETPVIRVSILTRGFASDVRMAWVVLALLGLALLAGSLAMADRLGRRFVEPIRSLARSAHHLGEDDLTTRISAEGPPEVQEVAVALNRLVERVAKLIERERENVADLSHRLRTPITALRLAVEAMPEHERERLSADVDTLDRMIDDVVREARRSQREGLVASADAVGVLRARTDFWRALAEDQNRRLQVSVPPGVVPVRSSRADLEAVIDALLDNVFSYTPEGSPVDVRLEAPAGGGGLLVVEDGGPGLPDSVDVSGRGVSRSGSTGLGLSIVRRTAEASGGHLSLERSRLGGARVAVKLGPAG